jgi:uncharacterized LabA/DUF88 family protein
MRVAIFGDSPNIFGMTSYMGKKIIFSAWLKHVMHIKKTRLEMSALRIYYDVVPGRFEKNSFIFNLEELGFTGIRVPLKSFAPNYSDKKFKSRTDHKLATDIEDMLANNDFDHLILISGDSDFEFVLDKCKKRGKSIEVWATRQSLSAELRKIADEYYFFEDFPKLLTAIKNDNMRLQAAYR